MHPLQSSVLNPTLAMEDLAKRLPLINQYILKNLDGKTMMNFKKSSRDIYQTLDREKYCWIKLINKYNERFEKFHELWKKVRFLYNRLALVIHCDSQLSSMTLPWQLLSVIKVVLVYQILLVRM